MSIFSKVGGAHPRRNKFNLSFDVKTTADMGTLYPVGTPMMMVPGDSFRIGHEVVAQLQPLVAPIMADISIYFYDFFVPFRLLWDKWEEFITRGVDGDSTPPLPYYSPRTTSAQSPKTGKGSNWDYFGFPVGVDETHVKVLDFPWRAYNLIWNEYFRDENHMQELPLVPQADGIALDDSLSTLNYLPQRVCWGRDMFTSALPFQQRGTPVGIPVVSSGITSDFDLVANAYSSFDPSDVKMKVESHHTQGVAFEGYNAELQSFTGSSSLSSSSSLDSMKDSLNDNFSKHLHINDITSADVADLRFMFQVQKFMERSARSGVRYTEFLRANFGVSPRDDRLQRPEFIGGTRSPILIKPVLQTSESSGQSTPTGTKYGQGMTADSTYSGTYYATEYGVMMTLMCIRPKTSYQQGVNRQWIKDTSWDFFNPLFQNLSEQEIFKEEIFATNDETENKKVWGFTGRYNELRHNQSVVTGDMRDTFDYWHLGRKFTSAPELNAKFLTCDPSKRIFAVQNEAGFILHIGQRIEALRPMVYMAEPGLIDHN